MREKVKMVYLRYEVKRGYMGHHHMNYIVSDVRLLKDDSLICSEYCFEDSKIFKGKGLKSGDKIVAMVTILEGKKGIKLSNYSDVEKM